MDSPVKDTMPIFTEWLIPDALGLHTEVWIRAASSMDGIGFHHPYRINLEVAEKEPLNWEHTRIEMTWKVPKDFIIDPWQLERSQPKMIRIDGFGEIWVEWNTEDLKQVVDLEAPVYSPKATEFKLKTLIFLRKDDRLIKKWAFTIVISDVMMRYQLPSEDSAVTIFPKPRIRLVSVDPSRRPPILATQHQAAPLQIHVPVPKYSPWVAWITIGSVSVCSMFLLFTLLNPL